MISIWEAQTPPAAIEAALTCPSLAKGRALIAHNKSGTDKHRATITKTLSLVAMSWPLDNPNAIISARCQSRFLDIKRVGKH